MFSAQLPIRLATLQRITREATRPNSLIRSVSAFRSRSVIFPALSRGYATPQKPKKGSVGESSRSKAKSTGTKATTTKVAKPKTEANAKSVVRKKTVTTKKADTAEKAKKKAEAAAKKKAAATKKKEKLAADRLKKKEKLAADRLKKKEKTAADRLKRKEKIAADRLKKGKTSASKLKEQEKSKLALLVEKALKPPHIFGGGPFLLFSQAYIKNLSKEQKENKDAPALSKEAAAEFKSLSESQKESYARASQERRAKDIEAHKAFILSCTPQQIKDANDARAALRRLGKKATQYKDLHDPRFPVRPRSPFAQYIMSTGRLSVREPTSVLKELGNEWKAMTDSEKEKYTDAYKADRERYTREYEVVFGQPPPSRETAASPSSST